MFRRGSVHWSVLVCVVVGMAGCEGGAPVVGVLRPASGHAEAYGRAIGNGIQMAVQDCRLPEGFRVVDADTASDPEVAAREFQRLVDEQGARIVLGGMTSDEATALIEVADETRVICLSPSASANNLATRSKFFYRLYPTDEAEGRTAARHLYDKLGVRSLVVYSDGSPLIRGVEAEFRQNFQMNLQGRIVDTVHLERKTWKMTSMDALAGFEPEAVYVVGHAERILEVLHHLNDVGFDGVRMTTSTFYLGDVIGMAGDDAEGVLFPLPPYDAASRIDPVNSFVESYQELYGASPDIFAANGYDAMRVAIHALSNTEVLYTPEIRQAMQFGMGDFLGVTGAIAFDDHGAVRRYPVIHGVFGGRVMTWQRARELKIDAARKIWEDIVRSGDRDRGPVWLPRSA